MSASAEVQTVHLSTVDMPKAATEVTSTLPAGIKFNAVAGLSITDARNTNASTRRNAPRKAVPEGSWTKLEGKGTWYEGLLTIFSDVQSGQSWEIDIEESDAQPGYYRILPYTDGTPIATMLGRADTSNYFYLNATDPTKVYNDGDWTCYGAFTFSQTVTENGWEAANYGTLTDGVITFPAQSFYYNQNGWSPANRDGEFKIALPGAVVKDYTFKVTSASLCTPNNIVTASIKYGADIASLKYIATAGHFTATEQIGAIVDAQGTPEEVTTSMSFRLTQPGIYTLLVAAYNQAGERVALSATHNLAVADDAENWKPVEGYTAKLTEGFLAGMFTDIDPEELDITLEENINEPGRYRFASPYANHSYAKDYIVDHSESHNHYIYVNATRPDSVYVELSNPGINMPGFGSPIVWSQVGRMLDAGYDITEIPADKFGTMANGVISIPAGNTCLAFNNEPYNGFYNNGSLTITLTETGDTPQPPVEETWTEIGKGTWVDGFFTDPDYAWIDETNNRWEVTIEESSVTPRRYRILPYTEGTPVATYLEAADTENYAIINATDSTKVYMEGVWTPFGQITFEHSVPENEWTVEEDEVAPYGTLRKDGIITFPAQSFAEKYQGKYYYANKDGLFMIGLPGSTIKNYTLLASAELCSDNDAHSININYVGADIAAIKAKTFAGYLESEDIDETLATDATDVDLTAKTLPVKAAAAGLNTTVLFAYDADGFLMSSARVNHFNQSEPTEEWTPVEGKIARFTETLISDWTMTQGSEMTCAIEQSAATPGRYRLVEPYAGFASTVNHGNHTHYLYINATDPTRVYIEPSALGVDQPDFGEVWVWSMAGYLMYYDISADMIATYFPDSFGTMKENVITLPEGATMISLNGYAKGSLYTAAALEFEIVDDPESSIADVNAAAETADVYYNLRGQRIAKPTAPGLYIRNNAKILVR